MSESEESGTPAHAATGTARKGPSYVQALLIPLVTYVASVAVGFTFSCTPLLGIGIIGGELSLAAFVILMSAATHSRALKQGKQPKAASASAAAVGVACGLLVLFPMFATVMLFFAGDGCGA